MIIVGFVKTKIIVEIVNWQKGRTPMIKKEDIRKGKNYEEKRNT